MFYIPKLGMQGNIEESLKRNQQTSNLVFNEVNDRQTADDVSDVSRDFYIVFGNGVGNTNTNSGTGTSYVTSVKLE